MAAVRLGVLAILAAVLALAPGVAGATAQAQGFGQRAGGTIRGCGEGQQSVPASAIANLPQVTVQIYDGFFAPSDLTVRPGTVVVWVNRSSARHTTTSWDRWDSGILRPGERCATWFVTLGTYEYLSIVAADQGLVTGTVTVAGPPIGPGAGGGGLPHRLAVGGPAPLSLR
jgi:plastocyanin